MRDSGYRDEQSVRFNPCSSVPASCSPAGAVVLWQFETSRTARDAHRRALRVRRRKTSRGCATAARRARFLPSRKARRKQLVAFRRNLSPSRKSRGFCEGDRRQETGEVVSRTRRVDGSWSLILGHWSLPKASVVSSWSNFHPEFWNLGPMKREFEYFWNTRGRQSPCLFRAERTPGGDR